MSDPHSNSRTAAPRTPASKTPTSRAPASRTPSRTPAAPDDTIFLETPFGNACEVTLDYFTDTVLPPLHPDINIQTLLSERSLKRRDVVTKKLDLWRGYGKKTPGDSPETNFPRDYHYLELGVRNTVDGVREVRPTLMFQVNQEGDPLFDNRTEKTLPDAFFLTTPVTKDSFQWENVAVVGELARFEDGGHILEVARKVVGSMTKCMRINPCRRFVYGFTIEDAKIRLWYGDRSQLLVTESFDFIKNYRPWLVFVVRLSFAKPHQLGWDSTIKQIKSEGQVQYEITVQPSDGDPSTYRTLAVLSDSGADRLLSRGTRVWKAVRIIDGEEAGAPVALKDTWVDSGREREGDVHGRFFRSEYFVKEHPELQEEFIPILAHGDVVAMGIIDCTPCCSSLERPDLPIYAPSQVHYRVIYAELGESLRDTTSLHVIFQILVDAVKGASTMHGAGWVHRDLSPGNILIVDGRGKIHDLEFATEDTNPKIGRTGTADFVAVEVDQQEYMFPPPPRLSKSSSPSSTSNSSFPSSPDQSVDAIPEFQYNSLHDLESLWWNAVYFTVNREVDDELAFTSPDQRSAQRLFASQLFYQQHERFRTVFQRNGFAHRVRCLHPLLNGIGEILEEVRLSLRRAYAQAEASIACMDPSIASGLADRMSGLFEKAVTILTERNVTVRRFDDGVDVYSPRG